MIDFSLYNCRVKFTKVTVTVYYAKTLLFPLPLATYLIESFEASVIKADIKLPGFRGICLDHFEEWTEQDQIEFVKELLRSMHHHQHGYVIPISFLGF